ncbi:response regulator [Arthrobacter sp. Sa2BUA2]|uniref:Transcriptional regulatory protein n=1 Tax=Arthrobacter pullicola TaxID=2762224 RepID=A0ABR8YL08_9MICC|nr:response regulator [Arthrobacter pullicola]MBD8044915.1 response regulator [Arthrobacter pullicola]
MNREDQIAVLVVEDETVVAEAHAEYVRRCEGFILAGIAHTAADALDFLTAAGSACDLILLDMNLPDLHGLDLLRRIRGRGIPADVIAITAVRELPVVRQAMSAGIAQYLIKPFTFASFSAKLAAYREYRLLLSGQGVAATQSEVDQALAALRPHHAAALPKGLSPETLEAVSCALKKSAVPLSASELSAQLAMSRITVRRYLEHLEGQRAVERSPRYGSPGRPELEYAWRR